VTDGAHKTLLLIYHSQSGNTERLAVAAAAGVARESGVELRVRLALEANFADLQAADALLLGTPENLRYMSGALKDFFDRTYYCAQQSPVYLPYALFVSAGNDGRGAVREVDRVLLGYRMKKVAEPLIVRGEIDRDAERSAETLGETLAAGLALGLF